MTRIFAHSDDIPDGRIFVHSDEEASSFEYIRKFDWVRERMSEIRIFESCSFFGSSSQNPISCSRFPSFFFSAVLAAKGVGGVGVRRRRRCSSQVRQTVDGQFAEGPLRDEQLLSWFHYLFLNRLRPPTCSSLWLNLTLMPLWIVIDLGVCRWRGSV